MPQGYEAGAAYVPVLPSFRYFQKRVRAEVAKMPDVELQVTPEVDDAQAKADLKDLEKPRSVQVDADTAKAQAKIDELAAARNAAVVQVDADISKAQARIEELETKRGSTKLDVDAEIAKAEAKIAQLEAKRNRVTVQADADTTKAQTKLAGVDAQVRALSGRRARISVDAPGAANTIALLGAVTVAAGAAGGAIGAALPAAIGGGIGALGALGGSAIGVAQALSAYSEAQDKAASGSEAAAEAANAFREKMQELTPAGRDLVNQFLSMEDGYKRFRKAMESATLPGITQLLQGVADAEGQITRGMKAAGESISNVAGQAGALLQNPLFQGHLERAFKNVVPVIDTVGFGVLNLSAQMVHFSSTSGQVLDGTAAMIRGLFDGMVGFYRNLAPHADGLNRTLDETGGLFRDLLSEYGALSGNLATNGLPILQQFRALLNQVMSTANTLATTGMPLLSGAASGMFGVFNGLLTVVSGLVNAFGGWAGPLATTAGAMFGLNKIMGLFGSSLGNVGFGLGAFTRQMDASGRSTTSFRDSVRGATGVGGKFRAGLGAIVTGGFNPLGVAMGVVGIGLGILGQQQQQAAVQTQNHLDRVNNLAAALQESNGAIDANVRKTAAQELQNYKMSDGVRNLINDYVKFAGPNGAQQLTNAYLGNGQALEDVRNKLQAVVAAETTASASTSTYGAATGNTKKEVTEHGQAAQQLLDILNSSSGTFQQAITNNKQLSWAVGGARGETQRLTAAELQLHNQRLGFLNADLQYRQSLTQIEQALKSATEATKQHGRQSLESRQANQQLEQAIISAADAAGRKAVETEKAGGTDREAAVQANGFNKEILRQAGALGGKMPPALRKYISNMSKAELEAAGAKVTTNEFGDAVAELPDGETVKIKANVKPAQRALDRFKEQLGEGLTVKLNPRLTGKGEIAYQDRDGNHRILGSNIKYFADGGLNPMRGGVAQTVPPNTWRVIGDRAKDDEAYIPINRSERSQSLLQETAQRMGFALMPLAQGAVLGDGGTNRGAKGSGKASQDALAAAINAGMSPEDVKRLTLEVKKLQAASDAQTAANTRLQAAGVAVTRAMLRPMVAQINTQSVPALRTMENHVGVLVVQAFGRMRGQFAPTQAGLTRTSTVGVQSFNRLTSAGAGATDRLQGQFATIRGGLRSVQTAFGGTATAVGTSWGKIREASARPTRWVLNNPFNKGIIAGWNKLNGEFNLNKHVKPIEVGFSGGGYTGDGAKYDPKGVVHGGEFVVRKEITSRARPFLEALNDGQAEALQATGGRYARMPGYARGGFVADTGSALNAAIARGARVARQLDGKPYVWGGASPSGVDCSGFMSVITNALRGESDVWRRLFTTASFGNGRSAGFTPGLKTAFAIGNSVSGGHMAGTLAGTNVESGGAHNTSAYGGPATGADDPQFPFKASLPVVGGRFVSGGGGGFDPGPFVKEAFSKAFNLVGQVGGRFPGNHMAKLDAGVARTGANRVKSKAMDRLSRMFATAGGAAGSPEVVSAVRAVASQHGWGSGAQWRALSSLISGESSWNPQAANPTSSARGLFQKMTSLHGPVEPTVAGQTRWGLNYIKSSYGNPANAYAKWSSRSPHWYDNGGVLPTGYGSFYNGTGRPEAVLTNQQWNDIHGAAMRGGRGPLIGSLNVPVQPGASPDQVIDSALHKVRVVERSGRYATV